MESKHIFFDLGLAMTDSIQSTYNKYIVKKFTFCVCHNYLWKFHDFQLIGLTFCEGTGSYKANLERFLLVFELDGYWPHMILLGFFSDSEKGLKLYMKHWKYKVFKNPYSNLSLEDQQRIFIFRTTKMNLFTVFSSLKIKKTFKKRNMKQRKEEERIIMNI